MLMLAILITLLVTMFTDAKLKHNKQYLKLARTAELIQVMQPVTLNKKHI